MMSAGWSERLGFKPPTAFVLNLSVFSVCYVGYFVHDLPFNTILTNQATTRGVRQSAAERKTVKYANPGTQWFSNSNPLRLNHWTQCMSQHDKFLVDLGRKTSGRSGDDREGTFLFQRISVLLHRFNSILLHDSFVSVDCPDRRSFHSACYS